MISLNDYLYSGNTLLKLLHQYEGDLRLEAEKTGSEIDLIHADFLLQIIGILERNEFLTDESQRIREFYKQMTREYPFLAITFRGRIKSLIRAEAKFNAYVAEYIGDYYKEHGVVPQMSELREKLELDYLYKIVSICPDSRTEPLTDRGTVGTVPSDPIPGHLKPSPLSCFLPPLWW